MPKNISEKCHALLIGVGQRPNIDVPVFNITVKDAEQIGNRLSRDCGFDAQNIKTLSNTASSQKNILTQLDALIEKTKNGADFVIVFFSGHGAKKGDDYYLIANDTTSLEDALKGTDFVEKLNKINTNKLLILLDCCHAAGVADSGNIEIDTKKLLQKDNRAVISSCRHGEKSFIGESLSLFTAALSNALHGKSLLNADKDKKLRLFDLASYLYATVSKAHTQQHTQLDAFEGKTSNFVIVDFDEGMPEFDKNLPITNLTQFGNNSKTISLDENVDKALVQDFENKFAWLKNAVINAQSASTSGNDSPITQIITNNNHYYGNSKEKNDKVIDKNDLSLAKDKMTKEQILSLVRDDYTDALFKLKEIFGNDNIALNVLYNEAITPSNNFNERNFINRLRLFVNKMSF